MILWEWRIYFTSISTSTNWKWQIPQRSAIDKPRSSSHRLAGESIWFSSPFPANKYPAYQESKETKKKPYEQGYALWCLRILRCYTFLFSNHWPPEQVPYHVKCLLPSTIPNLYSLKFPSLCYFPVRFVPPTPWRCKPGNYLYTKFPTVGVWFFSSPSTWSLWSCSPW